MAGPHSFEVPAGPESLVEDTRISLEEQIEEILMLDFEMKEETIETSHRVEYPVGFGRQSPSVELSLVKPQPAVADQYSWLYLVQYTDMRYEGALRTIVFEKRPGAVWLTRLDVSLDDDDVGNLTEAEGENTLTDLKDVHAKITSQQGRSV